MQSRTIQVTRIGIVTRKQLPAVLESIRAGVGRPDMAAFGVKVSLAGSEQELETIVADAVGGKGLMEFAAFDLGNVLRKELGDHGPQSIRLLIGNPLIMRSLVELVPDAGSYAPVTVLVDERDDGLHLSYDTMESFLAPYENAAALDIARDLDTKIKSLLTAAAAVE